MLFRQDVAAAKSASIEAIAIRTPRFALVWSAIALFSLVVLLWCLVAIRYARHESVVGRLVPDSGAIDITPGTTGVVVKILVREGSDVRVGDPLFELTGERESNVGDRLYADDARNLEAKRASLQDDLSQLSRDAKASQAALLQKRSILVRRDEEINQQIELEKAPTEAAQALYVQWSDVSKTGLISKAQLLQQQENVLQHTSKTRGLVEQSLSLKQDIHDVDTRLRELDGETARARRATERSLADVSAAITSNSVHNSTMVRAPVGGRVTNIMVHAGQAASQQDHVLTILPEGSKLIAELWLPTKAIGFVAPGSRVIIKYDAYPYQKFGLQKGAVLQVAGNAIEAQEPRQDAIKPAHSEDSYRVLVSLDKQAIAIDGRNDPLLPGMNLKADVVLEQRRLAEWIFEPLIGMARAVNDSQKVSSPHG